MVDEQQICHSCGGQAEFVSLQQEIQVGSRAAVVLDEFFRCAACGAEFYAPGQMAATQKRASDQIRKDLGLLVPEEIRRIREGLMLSQADFERLLGVGPKTVVRWEKGTVFQNSSTDALLRLVSARRENADLLAARHGVTLLSPESPAAQAPLEHEWVRNRAMSRRAKAQAAHISAFWSGRPLVIKIDPDDVADVTSRSRCA